MNSRSILAKKYATAFLNVFSNSFTNQDYDDLIKALPYIQKHHSLLVLLMVPALSPAQKKQCLEHFLATAQIPASLTPIVHLLFEDQRIELLADVCNNIIELYQERHGIMPFSIKSAQALSNNQLDSVKKYLAAKTGRSIIATTTIDKELIAGIRAQSSTFLLEYSLAQQLRALKNNEI